MQIQFLRFLSLFSFFLAQTVLVSGQSIDSTINNKVLEEYLLEENKSKKPKTDNSKTETFRLKDKMFFGGNLALTFGDFTFIDVSPLVGYRFNERLSVGIGAIYNYVSIKYSPQFRFTTSIYGAQTFARFEVYENIFLQVQPQILNLKPLDGLSNQRYWISSFFVGGGYRIPISDRASFVVSGLYNLNHTDKSPYNNPLIQMGFVTGF